VYVGHVGAALGAKRVVPTAALAVLIVASYLPDWIDAALCVTGSYHDTQIYSHSIPAIGLLAAAAGGIQLARSRGWKAALVVAALVVSHILLDYLTGLKPTWPGGPVIGLALYSRPVIDFLIETAVIGFGWVLYRATLPRTLPRWNESHLLLALLILMQLTVDVAHLLMPAINKC
jgi:membrane-bound metal-dependent hydrolase YbcI (DUF457 family)